MWPRVVEVMLGCWLAISPFVFNHPADQRFLWANDFAVAIVLIAISLASCRPAWNKLHLLNLVTIAYLVAVAYIGGGSPPIPPPYQNYMVLALILLLVVIIPTRSTLPPQSWQAFYEERREHEREKGGGGEWASKETR